jgi:hypothetical protein
MALPVACTQRIGRLFRIGFHGLNDNAGVESNAAVTLAEGIDG